MGVSDILIFQLCNETADNISFCVESGICPLPTLKPNKTKTIKQRCIIRYGVQVNNTNWNVEVKHCGRSTGIKLNSYHLTKFVRLQFCLDLNTGVLIVEGVKENNYDYHHRNRFLGRWSRNAAWDKRPLVNIGRGRSQSNNQNTEAPSDQPVGSLVSTPIQPSSDGQNPSDPGQLSSGHYPYPVEEVMEEDPETDLMEAFQSWIDPNTVNGREASQEYEARLLRLEEMAACKTAQLPIPRAIIFGLLVFVQFLGVGCITMWVMS